MPPAKITYDLPPDAPPSVLREDGIESGFIGTLQGLKYEYRRDITDRASVEQIASSKSDPGNGYPKTLRCFLQKCALGKTISRYMVLITTEQKLLPPRNQRNPTWPLNVELN